MVKILQSAVLVPFVTRPAFVVCVTVCVTVGHFTVSNMVTSQFSTVHKVERTWTTTEQMLLMLDNLLRSIYIFFFNQLGLVDLEQQVQATSIMVTLQLKCLKMTWSTKDTCNKNVKNLTTNTI